MTTPALAPSIRSRAFWSDWLRLLPKRSMEAAAGWALFLAFLGWFDPHLILADPRTRFGWICVAGLLTGAVGPLPLPWTDAWR